MEGYLRVLSTEGNTMKRYSMRLCELEFRNNGWSQIFLISP